MAWLSDWAKRVKLAIDQNDIDDTLANFPILVHLGTSVGRNSDDVSFVFDELESDANRKKIAVTTSDGGTQCYVEIEKWDDTNEEAWLWVKVPTIASGADTDLYLYYDKTKADNTDYVGDPSDAVVHNVWDDNFKLVTHMRDDPDTSHVRDSTQYANDGTKLSADNPAVTPAGKIDDAQDFDYGDYINCGETIDNSIDTELTLSALIDYATVQQGCIINSDLTFSTKRGFNLFLWDTGTYGTLFIDVGNGVTAGRVSYPMPNFGCHRVKVTWDGSTVRLYVGGIEVGTPAPLSGTYADPGKDIWIGRVNTGAYPFVGIIDEVRSSDIARPLAWIKASDESERDHLLDFGSEEVLITATAYTKFNRGFN